MLASAATVRMSALIAVRDLACIAGERLLFEDMSWSVEAGTVLFVTGANGSGKSTLLRTLAGLNEGASGAVELTGSAAYLGHALGLKPSLTGTEHLRFWARLCGVEPDVPDSDPFGIRPTMHLPVRVLSRGQAQRLALSRLLLDHRPVWLLDEPTNALDAEATVALAAALDIHLRQGGAAVVATHETVDLRSPQQTMRIGA